MENYPASYVFSASQVFGDRSACHFPGSYFRAAADDLRECFVCDEGVDDSLTGVTSIEYFFRFVGSPGHFVATDTFATHQALCASSGAGRQNEQENWQVVLSPSSWLVHSTK